MKWNVIRDDILTRCWSRYRGEKLLQAARILYRIRFREVHGRWPTPMELKDGIAA
jgi:hypothetical protein